MLRNILVLFPALAFALPFISSQPTSARPLATPAPEVDYCWGDCPGVKPGKKPGKGGGSSDEGGDASFELALAFCSSAQVLVEDRACQLQADDACLAACTEQAVEPYCNAAIGDRGACSDDTVRACRRACVSDGATFCDTRYKPGKKPGKKPTKPGKKPTKPGKEPTRPGKEEGGMIFVNVDQCLALGVDIKN